MSELSDNLGRITDVREVKRGRGLGFNSFFNLRSDDKTADFMVSFSLDWMMIMITSQICGCVLIFFFFLKILHHSTKPRLRFGSVVLQRFLVDLFH